MQINYHLRSRTEAECSLKNLYHIVDKIELKRENVNLFVDDDKITQEVIYQKALLLANNVEKWLELDYFMSKTPIDITELESIVKRWESEEHEKVIYKKYSIFRKNKG